MNPINSKTVLSLVPQQAPFRFIDEIISLNDSQIVATYTYKSDEYFNSAHFPGNPIIPGVILLETAAQSGVVALGIYQTLSKLPPEEVSSMITLFSEVHADFTGIVRPQQKVIIKAEKIYFRMLKLKVKFDLSLEDGSSVCSGTLAGIGVKHG